MSKLNDYIDTAEKEIKQRVHETVAEIIAEPEKTGKLVNRIQEIADTNPYTEKLEEEVFEPEVGEGEVEVDVDVDVEVEIENDDENDDDITEAETTVFMDQLAHVINVENNSSRTKVLKEFKVSQAMVKEAQSERDKLMLIVNEQEAKLDALTKKIQEMSEINTSVMKIVKGVKRQEDDMSLKNQQTDTILKETKQILKQAAGAVQYKTKIIDTNPPAVRVFERHETGKSKGLISKILSEDGKVIAVIKRDSEGHMTQIVEKR